MKRSVTVEVAGQRYALLSDSEEGDVRALAAFVDERIGRIRRETRTIDSHALAVMAALQIAEELFEERGTMAEFKRRLKEKNESLLRSLEEPPAV